MTAPKILVVDDQLINVQLLKRKLEREGITVISAYSGQEALDAVATEKPDLILLDVMMPEMDGIEVCTRLQSREDTRSIPVIFITARNSKEGKLEGLAVGARTAMYRVAMTPAESLQALDRLLNQPNVTREGMVVSTVLIEPRLDQWVHSPAQEQDLPDETAEPADDVNADRWSSKEEATLAALWSKMVSRAPSSSSDSFFDLGGDSLGIMTLAAAIQARFGKAIPLQKIMEKPTLGEMASLLMDEAMPAATTTTFAA